MLRYVGTSLSRYAEVTLSTDVCISLVSLK